jgi:hypothetical protein
MQFHSQRVPKPGYELVVKKKARRIAAVSKNHERKVTVPASSVLKISGLK